SKQDNSIYYSSCTIGSALVSRVKNLGNNRKAVQSTVHGQNLEALIASSESLLTNIARRYYRWSPTQTDYLITNAQSELTRFHAVGFDNLNNNSEFLSKSVTTIDQLCDDIANDFGIIGEFQLD